MLISFFSARIGGYSGTMLSVRCESYKKENAESTAFRLAFRPILSVRQSRFFNASSRQTATCLLRVAQDPTRVGRSTSHSIFVSGMCGKSPSDMFGQFSFQRRWKRELAVQGTLACHDSRESTCFLHKSFSKRSRALLATSSTRMLMRNKHDTANNNHHHQEFKCTQNIFVIKLKFIKIYKSG